MKTYKKALLFVITVAFLVVAGGAYALEPSALLGEGHYFIKSESSIVRAFFGSRHEFKGGFTSDLTRGELWTLRNLFGVSVEQIPLYHITQKDEAEDADDSTEQEEKTELEREHTPSSQLSWGVELVRGAKTPQAPAENTDPVTVALLDTGAEQAHSDLEGRVQQCVDFTRSSIVTNNCDDENGHGTHLTGILAGTGGADGAGIIGVAPHTNIFAYKVCRSDGSCWADDVAAGLEYAVENGADIVLLGFAGEKESRLVKEVLSSAVAHNILIIGPAGNRGPAQNTIGYPAAYEAVIGVGAVDSDLAVPEWSSRGTANTDDVVEEGEVTFAAPGVNIESTWNNGEYRYLSGSSVSVPFVGGLASLVWDGSATSTYQALLDSVVDVWETGIDSATGFGVPVLQTE